MQLEPQIQDKGLTNLNDSHSDPNYIADSDSYNYSLL